MIAPLASTNDTPQLSLRRRPAAIRVTFTDRIDPASVTTGRRGDDPATFSFLVEGGQFPGFVPGTIQFDGPNIARFVVSDRELPTFTRGDYRAQLFGDPGPSRPAIARPDGSRLDGEPQASGAFPSGDGAEGGRFRFTFVVVP